MENLLNFLIKVITVLVIEEALIFFPLIFLFFFSIFTYVHKKNLKLIFKLLIYFLPISYIFYVYSFLPNYFSSLGQDSLHETSFPNFGEAIFFLKNFFTSLLDPEIFKRRRFWLVLLSSLTSSVILYVLFKILYNKNKSLINYYNKIFNYSFILSSLAVLYVLINLAIVSFESGKDLRKFEKEFSEDLTNYSISSKNNKDLILVSYIGESTNTLNMQVYGYPFKNTPWLKSQLKEKNFMLFNNIYASATHTMPSLIDALSICTKNCDSFDVTNKKYITLNDISEVLNIETQLYSNQGSLGTHNAAAKLVLNSKTQFFQESEDEKLLGNRYMPKMKDKEFFDKNYCKSKNLFKNKRPNMIFLHSYAGHGSFGGYSSLIDNNVKFSYPSYINEKNLLGKNYSNYNLVKEYDTAIKYIDKSLELTVSCTFQKAKELNRPAIFIYFSDHGESPASGRGHDSARLTYEMIHVPFIMIFNEKAHELYSDKIKYLNEIKDQNASLKIISEIILYLFEVDIYNNINNEQEFNHQKFKSQKIKSLLKRQLLNDNNKETNTFWSSESLVEKLKDEDLKFQDTSISLWQINNFLKSKKLSNKQKIKNLVCQHRANSFVLQFKASISIGCFETDIHFLENKTISTHDLDRDTNLIFDDFLKSKYRKNTVWLDSKNINKLENCNYAKKWLDKFSKNFESLLVELPTNSINTLENKNWIECIKSIDKIQNVEVAYYLDTLLLKKCSDDLRKKILSSSNCSNLNEQSVQVLDNLNIKSITFDFNTGKEAVDNDTNLKNLKWHVWHVDSVKDINDLIIRQNTGIILVRNDKHLDNLN